MAPADVSVRHSAAAPAVELFEAFEDVERTAAGSLADARQPCLYDRLSWYKLIESHAPPSGKLLAARSGACWLPLAVEGRQARAYANWYTLRFSASNPDPSALQRIAASLKGRGRRISCVELGPLQADDPLPLAFRSAGWLTFLEQSTVNWRIDTSGMRFDDYWAARPSRLRNTARRKAKAAALDIAIYDRFDEAAWSDYEAVYKASWKPDEGSAAFLEALARQQGSRGTLRLGIGRTDGKPIAAQLWLVENGQATIHKLAYDEAARDLSPGTVLSMAMFRHVLDEDRVHTIDFGTGNDPYKAEWMDRCEPLMRMTAFNPRSWHGAAWAARKLASRLVQGARRQ